MRAWEFIAEARDPRESDPRIIQDVKDAYDMGYTAEQSAELLGLTFSAVKRILQAHYADRDRSQRERKPHAMADAVMQRLKQGQHRRMISKDLGISLQDINSLLQQHYPDREGKRELKKGRIDALSDQDKQDIITIWRGGKSLADIARQYDLNPVLLSAMIKSLVGQDEINQRLQSAGTHKHAISADDIPNIIKAYQSGRTVGDIGKEYGVNGNAIKYQLVKHGVFSGNIEQPLTQQQIDTAKTLQSQGYSIRQIADKLGMKNYYIGRYRLNPAGIH